VQLYGRPPRAPKVADGAREAEGRRSAASHWSADASSAPPIQSAANTSSAPASYWSAEGSSASPSQSDASHHQLKTMIVLGSGGHTAEMFAIVRLCSRIPHPTPRALSPYSLNP